MTNTPVIFIGESLPREGLFCLSEDSWDGWFLEIVIACQCRGCHRRAKIWSFRGVRRIVDCKTVVLF